MIKILEIQGLKEKGDVTDFINTFTDKEEAAERLSILAGNAEPYVKPEPKGNGCSAKELMNMKFPDIKWIVLGILTEGLSILDGKPKMGKSMIALNFGIAISGGTKALGKIKVEQGTVLYLALEDTLRRLKQRLSQMLRYDETVPEKLRLYTEWPRMGQGGLKMLEKEIQKYQDTRLVIIDTLAKFRPIDRNKNHTPYDVDYNHISDIKALADKYSISILMIHHLRKSGAEDVMDTFSGTLGLTGAADNLMALIRTTGQSDAELQVNGRDVESESFALNFDPAMMAWNLIGTTRDVKPTHEMQMLYDALKTAKKPLTPMRGSTAEIRHYCNLTTYFIWFYV